MSSFDNDRVFGTREEMMDWVQSIARNLGYVIVTQRTKKNVLGFVKKVYLMCDRGGEYKSTSKSTTDLGTKKCGCPFQLIAKYNHDPTSSGWKINVIRDEHNHDGNCGFRATASALGYDEDQWPLIRRLLIDEMVQFETYYKKAFTDENNAVGGYNEVFSSLKWSGTGFAPQKYWMIMPETGFLIANKFNVIFHFISEEGNNSATFFPLWRGPDQFPDKKIITIASVNSNHYVMVEMQGEFPMGFTHNLWKLKRERGVSEWKNIFKSRQKLYKEWIAKPAEYEVID